MQNLIKVTDFRNGAYPTKQYKNPFYENAFLVSQAIGNQFVVKNHDKLFYLTTDTRVQDMQTGELKKHLFLICKKDCVVVQENI